ncbi:MAG TPA: hypothetical protein V6D18_16570 [Thermosynechococcaceae cyanobacterium]
MKLVLPLLVLSLATPPAWGAVETPLEQPTPQPPAALIQPPPSAPLPFIRRETPLEPQTLRPVTQAQAKRYVQTVEIFAGRNSAIEFETGERIQFLQLSDPALMVFNTNAPVSSGQATVIVLRLIRPIQFPGLITTPNPNLTVTTTKATYFFNLQPSYRAQEPGEVSGITIVTGDAVAFNRGGETTIETRRGRATVADLRRGLEAAIRKGYSKPTDPIVAQVQRAMGLMRQGAALPEIVDAIQSPKLPSVLMRLGEMGIQEDLANSRGAGLEAPTEPPPRL